MSTKGQNIDVSMCSFHGVVVYQDRAEIKREICVNVKGGESEIIITGLSESIDGDSIRVEGQGNDATINDVTYYTSTKNKNEDDTEDAYRSILEKIKEKERELSRLDFHRQTLDKQVEMLKMFSRNATSALEDKKTDSSFTSLINSSNVAMMTEFIHSYETKLSSIDETFMSLQRNRVKIEEEKKVLEAKSDQLNPKKKSKEVSETVRTVKVTLETSQETDVRLIISYIVTNASWSPAYDVRVFTKDKTMKIHYYGLIKQSTGEDWDNTNLALSTAQPSTGGSPPQLGIHHIGFKTFRALALPKRKSVLKSARAIPTIGFNMEEFDENSHFLLGGQERFRAITSAPPVLDVERAKVESGQLYNTTYTIPRPATIPADNTEHKLTVAIIDLQPDFSYVSVPRVSPHSFLQAKVKNTSPYAILNGSSNVFLDNNFLAKSEIPDTSPNEDFNVSLGADQAIRIASQPVAVLRGSSGRLMKSNLLTYTYVYAVKNTQANVVELKVMEQVPLSSDERLKVTMLQPELKKQNASVQFSHGHALLNDDNNIEWHCTIPPDTAIELELKFSVEFPINDIVEGLNSF